MKVLATVVKGGVVQGRRPNPVLSGLASKLIKKKCIFYCITVFSHNFTSYKKYFTPERNGIHRFQIMIKTVSVGQSLLSTIIACFATWCKQGFAHKQ